MKIKDYKCAKCGRDDFFFQKTLRNITGIYCVYCGRWYKWADKNERNLADLAEKGVIRNETL